VLTIRSSQEGIPWASSADPGRGTSSVSRVTMDVNYSGAFHTPPQEEYERLLHGLHGGKRHPVALGANAVEQRVGTLVKPSDRWRRRPRASSKSPDGPGPKRRRPDALGKDRAARGVWGRGGWGCVWAGGPRGSLRGGGGAGGVGSGEVGVRGGVGGHCVCSFRWWRVVSGGGGPGGGLGWGRGGEGGGGGEKT